MTGSTVVASFAILMPEEVFARQFLAEHLARLEALGGPGCWFHSPAIDGLQNTPHSAEATVLLTGWGTPRLTPEILTHCPRLRLIAHCAGTVRHFVDPALFQHGVRLTTSNAANAVPVAEFLLSWVLRWNKQLPHWEHGYKAGPESFRQRADARFLSMGNRDKVIGIVGASKVGRHLMSLLRHFDLEVVVFDPFLSTAEASSLGARKVELDALLAQADIVSLNAPLLPETRHMIAAPQLALMKEGALLINTARGGIVDHDALLRELQSGRISAVLDVTDPEPLPAGSPFFTLDNVWLTPHVAGSLGREIYRMTDSAISEIELFLAEGHLRHEIGPTNWATAA
jgi:phosphoglycerate dehydrogenase-like enzyme